MKEINAVVGYVSSSVAKALGAGRYGSDPVEVRLEAGSDDLHVRVNPKDIRAVIVGAAKKGETGVQVFLNDKAKVDTVSRGAAADFLRPIRDLSLLRLRPPINVIYVDPQWLDRLVELNKAQFK
jgi:hypothetical protein